MPQAELRFENAKFIIEYFPSEKIVEFLIKDQELDTEDVVEMHRATLNLTRTEHYATLFSAMDFFSITAEARNEGSKRHYSAFVIVQAFVVKNMAQRLFANFIMKLNAPVRETRLFSTYDDARAWLRKKVAQHEAAARPQLQGLPK
jgi:hypothetical protein